MDVISMFQRGVENVVASSGTSLTEEQIHVIHRFTQNVTVIYDSDAAGIKASLRGIDMLLANGLNVKTVLLPTATIRIHSPSHTHRAKSRIIFQPTRPTSSNSRQRFFSKGLRTARLNARAR